MKRRRKEINSMNNPKPEFNLKWYHGEDLYSEGDIEDLIIELLKKNEPENYTDAIYDNFCWSVYYHLTHLRKNILNWYPFHPDAEVLEIGAGLGAVTGVLCDKCKSVVSVELSRRRAEGILWRCREKENLEIIVGNLNDIQFEKKFDYITLIGVLEYQGNYTDTENPYLDFLKRIKQYLKPNGKLLLAIENQFGLKYWCGAKEDHTLVPFNGIHQYTIKDNKTKTFSRAGLEGLLKKSGFKNTYFYYPMPDYKLPTVIYSQRHLPTNANMQNMQCYYAPDRMTLIAQEENLYQDIIENNVFEFFANSFFVECTDLDEYGAVEFCSMSSERIMEYQIGTRFLGKNQVEKFALKKNSGCKHIQQVIINQEELKKRGLSVWEYWQKGEIIVADYTDAKLWEEQWIKCMKTRDISEIFEMTDLLYDQILKSSDKVSWEENIMYSMNLADQSGGDQYGPILKKGYLDMIARNAFLINEQLYWFDQEWTLENVPAKFVLYRAFVEFYSAYSEMDQYIPLAALAEKYGLLCIWGELKQLNELFGKSVMDEKHLMESSFFRNSDRDICLKNIQKIM